MDTKARHGDTDDTSVFLPAARQARLAELVRVRGQVSVVDLVSLFGVSRDAVRRDLAILEERGLLVKTHGGAMAPDRLVHSDTPFTSRMDANPLAKERIGKAAARLIRNGETLMLNGGSSTTHFAAALGAHREITIVTNNLRALPALPTQSLRKVYVLGGAYAAASQVTVEFSGFSALPRISVDTAVVGVTGLSAQGCFIGKLDEAIATEEMIRACRRTILLANHSKFGVEAFARVTDFANVEILVTDMAPPEALANALADAAVRVLVAT